MTVHLSPEKLEALLEAWPRRVLFSQPSPIQRLSRLGKALDTPAALYIKRDDQLRCFFGNKIRYLEYVLGLYDQAGADCLLHAGGMTSNYMAQLALIGASEGIPIHLILDGEKPEVFTGNPLLEEMCGARVHYQKKNEPTNRERKKKLAQKLRDQGRRPYVIDYPYSNFTAYLGYMRCYLEICEQEKKGPQFDMICLCSGWHSYLGLRMAADLLGHQRDIVAFRPARWNDSGLYALFPDFNTFLGDKVKEFASFLGMDIPCGKFQISEGYVGPGYGKTDARTLAAIHLLAIQEGILLDPIYSGKAFAGLLEFLSTTEGNGRRNILFIHTGGTVNLFSFTREITGYLNGIHPCAPEANAVS